MGRIEAPTPTTTRRGNYAETFMLRQGLQGENLRNPPTHYRWFQCFFLFSFFSNLSRNETAKGSQDTTILHVFLKLAKQKSKPH